MGIAGLSTYSSTGFYYAMNNRSKTGTSNKESDFGIMQEKENEKPQSSATTNSIALESAQGTYSRCIAANIRIKNVDLSEYPDVAGAISEELSSEKIKEEAEPEEIVTSLGFGFANAGMMGYGMSAALVEKPGCDDTIIRVKLATGSGNETIDVNLSDFDPTNATPVEMFAYCQYKDSIGEGVDSKWGSWNAMKSISSPYDGCDFGSLDNIMNKQMNWSGKLEQSQTSWMDPNTNEVIMSASDLLKMLEESHKLTAKDLKGEKDWREISDDESFNRSSCRYAWLTDFGTSIT